MEKALARQQPLLQAVPIAEPDEAGVFEAQLVAERALGALGKVIGELIGLEVYFTRL
jgi:hypothetical protein